MILEALAVALIVSTGTAAACWWLILRPAGARFLIKGGQG